MLKVKLQSKSRLSEIVHYGFEYSLLNEELEALHQPVQCKDFLTDAFWSEHTKQPCSIYGFNWTPGTMAINEPWYRLALRYKDQDIQGWKIPMALFMGRFDKAFGFKYTRVDSANDNTVLVVKFDGGWTKQPILVSTFSQLLRLAATYDGVTPILTWLKDRHIDKAVLCSEDAGRISQYIENLKRMMKDGIPKQTYAEYTDLWRVHGDSGLINYFNTSH